MILTLAQSNPSLFQVLSERRSVLRELKRLEKLKELLETSEEQLRERQREEWTSWVQKYRERLALEFEGESNVEAGEAERVRVMNCTNPRVVLRNYIAQNAIEAAECGDFSEVQRVLKVLQQPYTDQPGLEMPGGLGGRPGAAEEGEREEGGPESAGEAGGAPQVCVPYNSKPPAWAAELCVT